jgi:ATP-binding cassette subfamily F protein 2
MEADGLITLPLREQKISFKFEDRAKLPPPIISFTEVAFSYDGNIKHALYKNLEFGIDMDSRVAIVGKNGTGKSTLVNLITGDLMPIEGSVSRHTSLKLAKYSQHSADQLPYDKTPLQYFMDKYKEKYPGKEVAFWRSQLGRFGISGSHQTSEIRVLSDGLKARVVFSQLALESPHIILLDEPTNHLDIQVPPIIRLHPLYTPPTTC